MTVTLWFWALWGQLYGELRSTEPRYARYDAVLWRARDTDWQCCGFVEREEIFYLDPYGSGLPARPVFALDSGRAPVLSPNP